MNKNDPWGLDGGLEEIEVTVHRIDRFPEQKIRRLVNSAASSMAGRIRDHARAKIAEAEKEEKDKVKTCLANPMSLTTTNNKALHDFLRKHDLYLVTRAQGTFVLNRNGGSVNVGAFGLAGDKGETFFSATRSTDIGIGAAVGGEVGYQNFSPEGYAKTRNFPSARWIFPLENIRPERLSGAYTSVRP